MNRSTRFTRSLRLPALVAGCLLAVGACNTTSPASPSPSPTATPRASQTLRPTGTPRPTETQQPTKAPIQTVGPSFAPGAVIFADALTSDDGIWPTGDLDAGSAAFTDNAYRLTITDPGQYQDVYPSTMSPPPDTSTQVDSTFVAGPDASLMGLICRSGPDGYYVLQASPDGTFSLYLAAVRSHFLVDWTQSGAIKTGTGQTNTFRLDCVGHTLTAYVNGTQIAQATDSALPDGDIGIGAVSTDTQGGTTYDFANFAISYPQP